MPTSSCYNSPTDTALPALVGTWPQFTRLSKLAGLRGLSQQCQVWRETAQSQKTGCVSLLLPCRHTCACAPGSCSMREGHERSTAAHPLAEAAARAAAVGVLRAGTVAAMHVDLHPAHRCRTRPPASAKFPQ